MSIKKKLSPIKPIIRLALLIAMFFLGRYALVGMDSTTKEGLDTEEVVRLQRLVSLSQYNAYPYHSRYWATGGVIDPLVIEETPSQKVKSSPIKTVFELSQKLEEQVTAIALKEQPTNEDIAVIVKASQAIQLALSRGVSEEGKEGLRPIPQNAGEWEVIRKALFLALSVLSEPEKSGRNFLSPLYDCGGFYHDKSDKNDLKDYIFRLEAYGYGFAVYWKSLKDKTVYNHQAVIDTLASIDLYNWLGTHRKTKEAGAGYPVFQKAHQAVIQSFASFDKGELSKSLALSLKVNHEKVFNELYPDLMTFTCLHTPCKLVIEEIMTGEIPPFDLSKDFAPQAVHLRYQGNSWSLVVSDKKSIEHILWKQKGKKDRLLGSLNNDQGQHLFHAEVDGNTATIKAISSGYQVKIGGAGASIVVANDKSLGVIESSAYPLDIDSENYDESAIEITGASYDGSKGFIDARRGTVSITAPIITLRDHYGYEGKQHNGKAYNFYKQQGHGIKAHRHVLLRGDDIDLSFSEVRAGFSLLITDANGIPKKVVTHGSLLESAYVFLSHLIWEADTQTVFAGSDGSNYQQNPNDLVPNSAQASINYSRALVFNPSGITVLNDVERETLLKGDHTYRAYDWISNLMPTFKPIIIEQPVSYKRDKYSGGYGDHRGFGGYSNYNSYSNFTSNTWGVSGMKETMMQKFNASFQPQVMPSQGLQVSNIEFGMSNRGGSNSFQGNIDLTSQFQSMKMGTTSIGFNYKSGEVGKQLALQSQFNPGSLEDQVRLGTLGIDPAKNNMAIKLHTLSSAAILQMSAPKDMNAGAIIKIWKTLDKVTKASKVLNPSTVTKSIRNTALLSNNLENDQEELQISNKTNAKSSTGGGDKDPDSDEEKRKKNCEKSESPVWKDLQSFKGRFKTDLKREKIYDWDHTHQDIEVYNQKSGDHLGSMDPINGQMYKPPVKGRNIRKEL